MYESFFGFVNRPFLAAPSLDRYFPSNTMEQTVQTAARAISRAEGPVAVFGGTGLGKTLCCLRLAEHFHRSFDVVMLASSPLVTRRALLQSLLFELQMPYKDLSEGELRLTLMNRLQSSQEAPSDGVLLIVDEAQTLSFKLLDEIRLLTNIHRKGVPRVRLVLCGNMKLEETLYSPQMESLSQRLAARCYLTPLSSQETAAYAIHKIELCGVNHARVITRDALEALHRGSDGIPRLIDQLADQAMLIAAQSRTCPVTADVVGKAWGMLQQLPNPWSEPESIKAEPKSEESIARQEIVSEQAARPLPMISISNKPSVPSIVEFGPLDEVEEANGFEQEGTDSVSNVAGWNANGDIGISLPSDFQSFTPSPSPAELPVRESFEDYRLQPIQEAVPAPSKPVIAADPFGSDFDEEFNLPVQSSTGYQSYSGIAFGSLNHDLERIESFDSSLSDTIEEADAFIDAEARLHEDADQWKLEAMPASPLFPLQRWDEPTEAAYSNITPSQAASLERQVEEEMRDLVSELNLSAMAFDPTQIIVELEPSYPIDSAPPTATAEEAIQADAAFHTAGTFAEMRDEWNQTGGFGSTEVSKPIASDDRDMLVIEEDLETIKSAVPAPKTGASRPVLHPYAKLFSNLRSN
ncbi:MAG: AAA family ATPase [Pirellula sp.]|jgi:type II secretory pathway predicted ATPase ExeA|nr:AAA family ATPase [Pirellula sp.]